MLRPYPSVVYDLDRIVATLEAGLNHTPEAK